MIRLQGGGEVGGHGGAVGRGISQAMDVKLGGVVGTAIIVGALAQLSLQALGHPELAFLAFSLGLFAAAVANWVVGRRLNSTPPRELIDPATNACVLLTRRHALLWIRMEYWSAPVARAAFVPLLALRNL